MGAPAGQAKPERVKMAAARVITGKGARSLQLMAAAGQIPGAAKIGNEWTFDEARLRAWVKALEEATCANANRQPTVTGAGTRSGAGSRSKGGSSDGRYEQAMSALLRLGSKPNESGKSRQRTSATPAGVGRTS